MKKLLLVYLLVCFAYPVLSQGFRGKIIAGLNAAQVDGDGMSGFYKPGLVIGGAAEYFLTKKWSFEPEFLYSQKGARTSNEALEKNPNLVKKTIRFNYIDIPVIFTLHQYKDLTFHFGPAVSVLVAAKYDDGTGFFDVQDRINKIDILASGGAEYVISPRFSFNARYSYSMIPLGETPVSNILIASGRNNVLTFTMRYNLNVLTEE